MNIRAATNEDIPAIKQIVYEVLKEYRLKPEPEGADKDIEDIQGNYFDKGGYFFVLEDEDKEVIGCAGIYKKNDQLCELRKMYFLPIARGKGYGKRLLHYIIELGYNLGFKRMELETSSNLKEATKLYENFGFKLFNKPNPIQRCDQALYLEL